MPFTWPTKLLLMYDVDDYAFGEATSAMTEEALGRLYDIPMRKVQVGRITSLVPLFSCEWAGPPRPGTRSPTCDDVHR